MKLREMRQILAAGDVRLRKSLGQCFLHDENQLRRIVAAAELGAGDRVLEIGPGLGPLTEFLIARAGHVTAIETDCRLIAILQERFAATRNLMLVHADALEYVRTHPTDWSGWKLVANLPYSIASPLLIELAQKSSGPERMVVTVQLEVAGRLTATTGERDYGLLSLLVQVRYVPLGWFKIPASCFFPKPKVDSACITLVRRTPAVFPADVAATFERLVKRGFAQRRKMLFKLLKEEWPSDTVTAALERLDLGMNVRAEQLSLEQFVKLARLLHAGSGREEWEAAAPR
jgi:16S rRNA (adenine1518-N6/adenine1519-N6)-dimethyltransferase